MDVFSELQELFKLKKLKIKTQTRKTLLKWAQDVKFEERRKAFYEACEPGKVLSKVSICKLKKRPDWSKRLEMLKTKDLRKAIKDFLHRLGVLEVQSQADLKKLAKTKHWHKVLSLTQDALEDTKKGGTHPLYINRDGRRVPNPNFRQVDGQSRLQVQRGRNGRIIQDLRSMSPSRGRVTSGQLQAREDWGQQQNDQYEMDRSHAELQEILHDQELHMEHQNELIQELIRTRDKLLKPTPGQQTPPRSPKKRTPDHSPRKRTPERAQAALSGGGGYREKDELPLLAAQDQSRCVLFDPDEVYCTPVPLGKAKLKKKQNTVIQTLTFRRKQMCEKLHFMQLKLKELELNQRLWKAFEYSRQGDFMANFSKKDLSQFQKCGKNAIWTPSQLHELKAVSACMSRSQELCRNYRDGKARFQNEDVLSDKEYMLGNFSVEELETMRRSYGDPWVKRALKNREREPVYSRQQLICEKGPRQEVIVQKQLPPENKEGLESKVGTINMGGLGTGDGGLVDTRSGNQLGGVASSTPDPVTGVAGYSGRLPATSGNIPRETGVVHGRTALRGGERSGRLE
jgi:hypothetical protein